MLYLRPGTREHFLEALARDWPELLPRYERLYEGRAYLPATETDETRSARAARLARESVGFRVARRIVRSRSPSSSRWPSSRHRLPAIVGIIPCPRRTATVAENGEITVLIADDHEVVREGLRLALLRSPHIRVVGRGAATARRRSR